MIIKKKSWPNGFEAILNRRKKFDLRLADFECNEGDILVLEEFDPKTKKYTGRKMEKTVGYVLKSKEIKFWDEKEMREKGFQIISFAD